jgi:sugar-specific transcriptional regulator TrmB
MVLDKDAEVLNGLGLTTLQAKTYLAIAILEKATVKTISKTAKIARQEIYRVTSELQEKGLIEKIIATPVEYRAIPVHDAINVLL